MDAVLSCEGPNGWVRNNEDCDDNDGSLNPETVWFSDEDGDGYGTGEPWIGCVGPEGSALLQGDCDDSDASINPGTQWRLDLDGDGYGDEDGEFVVSCADPGGLFVKVGGDCNDDNSAIHPGALEVCDGVNQDCDDQIDEEANDMAVLYVDEDGDGFGGGAPGLLCPGDGTAAVGGDCDDDDDGVSPTATEVCNGVDDDCDGEEDDPDELTWSTFSRDDDGDGYGDEAAMQIESCVPPEGFGPPLDCDDDLATVNPLAEEVWYDGVDQDCDGNDGDQDGDGAAAVVVGGEDCDDLDATVGPEDCSDAGNGRIPDDEGALDPEGAGLAAPSGCGCESGGPGLGWGWILGLAALGARRRRG